MIMIYYASWQHKLKKTYIHKIENCSKKWLQKNQILAYTFNHTKLNILQNFSTQQT